jgi:hypothetical protein
MCPAVRSRFSLEASMRRTLRTGSILLALAAGLLALSTSLSAHHGAANYDVAHTLTLKGTITEYKFTNPHVLFSFDVKKDDGTVEKWEGEASNPLQLARQGWTSKTFKAGDELTFIGHGTKSGAKSLWITSIVYPDGKEFTHLHNEYEN